MRRQTILGRIGIANVADAVVLADIGGAAIQRGWLKRIGRFTGSRSQLEAGGVRNVGFILHSLRVICTRSAVGLDDPFGKQIVHRVAGNRLIGGKYVVERAILAHDHDDVLDGGGGGKTGCGVGLGRFRGPSGLYYRSEKALQHCDQGKDRTRSVQEVACRFLKLSRHSSSSFVFVGPKGVGGMVGLYCLR